MNAVTAALAALAVAGAFGFAATFHPARYYSFRSTDQRLYFRVLFYVFFLTCCAFLLFIHLWAGQWLPSSLLPTPDYPALPDLLVLLGSGKAETLPALQVILLLAFLLALPVAHLANLPFLYPPFHGLLLRSALKGQDFERLVSVSERHKVPLLLTLTTGKVYAGIAVASPNPSRERKYLRILPFLSGYRRSEDQRVAFTTDYLDIHLKISAGELPWMRPEDLEIVLPVETIISTHLFDLRTYEYFQAQAPASGPPPASAKGAKGPGAA